MMTLNQYLNHTCIDLGISMRELAIRAGINVQSIYLLKKRKPAMITYERLANYLDVELGELVNYPIKRESVDWDEQIICRLCENRFKDRL